MVLFTPYILGKMALDTHPVTLKSTNYGTIPKEDCEETQKKA